MPMWIRSIVALVAAGAAAATLAPASRQSPAIAPGVTVGTLAVGGMTSEPARDALRRAYERALVVRYGDRSWRVPRADLRVRAAVDDAVARALQAQRGAEVAVEARVSSASVRTLVAKLARSVDTKPRAARLVGFAGRPVFAPARDGVTLRRDAAARAIAAAAERPAAGPIELPTSPVPAKRTVARFGPVVIVDRSANRLRLYHGTKLVRTFGVATGQAVYPTPAGLFRVVDMQRDPWWIPPPSPWAAGAHPVPPGPGNPLGTRWMGISAPGVGMHGTPDDASIGYSVSHGCIRMHIPDAEWLFEHVAVGTPVLIR